MRFSSHKTTTVGFIYTSTGKTSLDPMMEGIEDTVTKEGFQLFSFNSRENVEAEAIDLILSESLETCLFVFEIDVSELSTEAIADAIERIMKGEVDDYPPGKVDWSMVVMNWY